MKIRKQLLYFNIKASTKTFHVDAFMGIPWADRPWTPYSWTTGPLPNPPPTFHAPPKSNRMDIDGPGFRRGEVQAVNNPGLAGRDMARGPTPGSSTRADPGPLRATLGMASVVAAPSTPQAPRQVVASAAVVNPISANGTRAVPLPSARKSEAARLRTRDQRQAASATRKEEDKTRARARQARAVERL